MSRKRWMKRLLTGVLAFGSAGGCKQQLFMEPGDYRDAVMNTLPRSLENSPHATITPSQVNQINAAGVASILSESRPGRMITLRECIAVALEQGNTGSQSPNNFGFKVDNPNQFNGRGVSGSDSLRVFAVDPAIQAAELERSLSKFDARWINSMNWQKVDTPTPAQFLSFQNSRDTANFTSTLAKPLPTGGVVGITASTDYQKFTSGSTNGFVNPNYIPRLQFTFEQPLLRLFGVEANQLAANHPGSTVLNLQPSGGQGTEGILISRIRVDQQKAEFDIRVNYQLANVETAYWNLYAAYYNLYAQEEGLRQAFEGYVFIDGRVIAGFDPPQNLEQSRAQFERFRSQVYRARGQVLESERQLRGLMNLRSDDGYRLVPIDKPNEAAYRPDFYEAANEALANRPDLLQARQDLKASQLNLLLQKNLRRADVRAFGQYDIAGLGTRLDGPEFTDAARTLPGNALTSFGNNQFNSWTLGLRMDIPLGFRDANAQVREGQLSLARSYYQLRDSEMKVLELVVLSWRRVIETHTLIGPAREERKALQRYLGKTAEVIKIGSWTAQYFQNYLTVQQQLAAAISAEFQAIANYNAALAQFEWAKGTILRYNNVTVNEGPLPPWAQKKAADHIRERTESALKLRERDAVPPLGAPGQIGGESVGPPTGSGVLADLPPFAEKRDPLPEKLPEPSPKPMTPPVPTKDMKEMKDKEPAKLPLGGNGDVPPMIPNPVSRQFTPPVTSEPSAPVTTGGAATPAEDYFRPTGRVTLPPIDPPPAPKPDKAGPATPAVPPLSAGTGLAPLPIPQVGTPLPVPPVTGDGFGPASSLPIPGK